MTTKPFSNTRSYADDGYQFGRRNVRGPLEWRPKPKVPNHIPTANDHYPDVDLDKEISELRLGLQAEKEREETLWQEINNAVNSGPSSKSHVKTFEQAVARLANKLEDIEGSTKVLAGNLSSVSVLADSISARVAVLDVAKSRVVECLQRVNDLRDLRTCSESVGRAIENEEFEEAAQYIHRFNTLEDAVFKMGSHFEDEENGQSLKHSYNVLRESSATLKGIIEKNFDEAVEKNDVASMQRFFKLFPLINEHTSGLQKFGIYLCTSIAKSCASHVKIMETGGTDDKRRNVLYSDTMTMVLEEIAKAVQEYQPLIDNFYGPDKLLNLMEIIQTECDVQTTKVMNAFVKNRSYEQRARTVKELLRGHATPGTDKLDAIALDVVLSEVTLIHTRAEMYWRFLKRRLGEAPARPLSEGDSPHSPKSGTFAEADYDDDDELTEEERRELQERQKRARVERTQKLDTVLNRSKLGTRMQEILGQYVMMEQFYMQESVMKALDMEDAEEGSLTTSVLDDVFFIVKKSIRRSITSSSVDCVCAMINNGMTLLETSYMQKLDIAIKAGYPSTGWTAEAYQHAQTAYNVFQHGKSVAEAGPETQKKVFLAALNNIRASVQCLAVLKEGLSADFEVHLKQISPTERGKLEHSVNQCDELSKRFDQLASIAVSKLAGAAFRPKLKEAAELYIDFSHELTEEQLNEYEAADPFMEGFVSKLDFEIQKFSKLLLPENYEELLGAVTVEAAHQIERVIFKCGFNQLGGFQLDKEYRQLASYFSTIAGWKVRENCAKLSQIVNLLTSDSVDDAVTFFKQLQSTSAGAILTSNELKRVLNLRTDFLGSRIKELQL